MQTRYLFQLGKDHIQLWRLGDRTAWTRFVSADELLASLGEPRRRFARTVVESQALVDSYLPTLLGYAEPDSMQVFHHPQTGRLDVSILDEFGALFQQRFQTSEPRFVLTQLHRFLLSMIGLRQRSGVSGRLDALLAEPLHYRLEKAADGSWCAVRQSPPGVNPAADYLDLLLLVDDNVDLHRFTLVCQDQEFSTQEFGDQVYTEVVRFVLARRRGREPYPVYLTAIDMARFSEAQHPAGVELLTIKRRIEQRLASAMAQLTSPPL